MSRCLNKATLIGYLGADPEVRTTQSGARVAQFSLATTRRWTGRDGQPREKTQWHRVVVWDTLPATFAFAEKYLRKGARVFVEGEIDYRSYEDKDGNSRWTTEIKATELLGAGETNRPGAGQGERARGAASRQGAPAEEQAGSAHAASR